MIKDKITPEIKNKFIEAVKRTEEIGIEHAFIMCKDEKGNLHPRDICSGERCTIKMESPAKCFPHKAQGNFHTHADASTGRRIFKEKYGIILPKELVISFVKEVAQSKGIDVTTPSHEDLINALINKCIKRTEGTVCIGSDAVPDRVDCWTARNTITDDDCWRAKSLKLLGVAPGTPKPWIKPLFDKEIIDLK